MVCSIADEFGIKDRGFTRFEDNRIVPKMADDLSVMIPQELEELKSPRKCIMSAFKFNVWNLIRTKYTHVRNKKRIL